MDEISVFLAFTSPLVRMRLRSSVSQLSSVCLAGEAGTAMAAVEQLRELQPQILLTDRVMLTAPQLVALLTERSSPRVVLIAETNTALGVTSPVPVARTLPFTLPPQQLVDQLRQVLAPPPAPAPAPPVLTAELRQRFHFSGAADPPAAPPPAAQPSPQPQPASRQGQKRRRTPTSRQERLVAALQVVQRQQRTDSVTGLTGPEALEQVRAVLPTVQQAVALVGIVVQDEQGQLMASPPPEVSLLRRLSATLRANVRRDDLVCRTGPASFVVVLPGTRWEEAAAPLERIRTALAENCHRLVRAAGAHLTVGVSYWEAGSGAVRGTSADPPASSLV